VATLADHARDVLGHDLCADRPRCDRADLLQHVVVAAADLGEEARVGGDAVEHAPAGGGPDLVDRGGVEEDLHRAVAGASARISPFSTVS